MAEVIDNNLEEALEEYKEQAPSCLDHSLKTVLEEYEKHHTSRSGPLKDQDWNSVEAVFSYIVAVGSTYILHVACFDQVRSIPI